MMVVVVVVIILPSCQATNTLPSFVSWAYTPLLQTLRET